MNQLRDQGILIGITGQYSQVLKIRPPLVFENKHADMLLDGLKIILEDL
jgi:4-aminobutyrate aminotransferase-like enzyme